MGTLNRNDANETIYKTEGDSQALKKQTSGYQRVGRDDLEEEGEGSFRGALGDLGLGLLGLHAPWPQPDVDSGEQDLGGSAAQGHYHTDFLGNHSKLEREKYLPQAIP